MELKERSNYISPTRRLVAKILEGIGDTRIGNLYDLLEEWATNLQKNNIYLSILTDLFSISD